MRALSCLLFLAAAACAAQPGARPAPNAAASCERRAADPALARLVASSRLILVGTPEISSDRLRAAAAQSPPEYFDFAVAGTQALKGRAASDPLNVRDYPGGSDGGPADGSILGASGTKSILFLVEGGGRPNELYFAGNSEAALQPAAAANLAAAKGEIARQARIVADWRPRPDLPHFSKVRELIEALVAVPHLGGSRDARIEAQQRIFEELERLGPPAVPSIITQMDDRRPLAVGQISLQNRSPNAWEGIRHYGPDVVVDALDAILSQITGLSFMDIQNGGSEEGRRAAVNAWRVYAHDSACYGSG